MATPICNILFFLIIIVLAVIICSSVFNIINFKEGFYYYSNRENKLKIYKSYEIKDPDETPETDYDDPDSNPIKYDID